MARIPEEATLVAEPSLGRLLWERPMPPGNLGITGRAQNRHLLHARRPIARQRRIFDASAFAAPEERHPVISLRTMSASKLRPGLRPKFRRPIQLSLNPQECHLEATGTVRRPLLRADAVSWSMPSVREFSPSATDESRLSRRCSGHACSCRCAPPWVRLSPARPPCIRHLLFPATEGDRHGVPAPVLAPHRAALSPRSLSW
jgi:hypothetical protein